MMLLFVYGNILKANPINLAEMTLQYISPLLLIILAKSRTTRLFHKRTSSAVSQIERKAENRDS